MGSCVFRCDVIEVDERSLKLEVTVMDGQSIAGMSAQAMPASHAFALQFLVETTWTARDVDPRLAAFAATDPGPAELFAAASTFIADFWRGSPRGFPVHEPGWEYNEQVERGVLERARLQAIVTVTDPAYVRHLAPGWSWDSPCGQLFE